MDNQNSYKFFQNKDCQYFPCHKTGKINCLFCYCPLYWLDCKGNFKILDNGVKDCSECEIPHSDNGYEYIVNFIKEINLYNKLMNDIYNSEEYLNDNGLED